MAQTDPGTQVNNNKQGIYFVNVIAEWIQRLGPLCFGQVRRFS